jgi:hypothetical protein
MTPIRHPADAVALLYAIAIVMCAVCGVACAVALVWGGV